jgi:hypothetical protein
MCRIRLQPVIKLTFFSDYIYRLINIRPLHRKANKVDLVIMNDNNAWISIYHGSADAKENMNVTTLMRIFEYMFINVILKL